MNALAACANDCTHKACAKARFVATSDCVYCFTAIGFGEPYVEVGAIGIAHQSCVEATPFRGVLGLCA